MQGSTQQQTSDTSGLTAAREYLLMFSSSLVLSLLLRFALTVVLQDEPEFQMWTGTLSMLIEGKTNLTQYLLAIQKRQLDQQSQSQGPSGLEGPGGAGGAKGKKQMKNKGANFKENEANDVYAFGWGEWGQNGTGSGTLSDMEACPNPKLLEVSDTRDARRMLKRSRHIAEMNLRSRFFLFCRHAFLSSVRFLVSPRQARGPDRSRLVAHGRVVGVRRDAAVRQPHRHGHERGLCPPHTHTPQHWNRRENRQQRAPALAQARGRKGAARPIDSEREKVARGIVGGC